MKLLDLELAARDRAILSLLMYGGLRSNELRCLNIEDLDFEEGSILIRHGKRGRQRIVTMNSELKPALRAHLNGRRTGALFLSQRQRRITNRGLRYVVKRWGERAGIQKRIHPHALRHTFAVLMLEGAVDLKTIQDLMGHESIKTTAIYLHCTTQRKRWAVEQICLRANRDDG